MNIIFNSEPRAFVKNGDKMVTEIEDLITGIRNELVSDGVFIFIGMKPNIELFRDSLQLDQWGYIKSDENMKTSISDIYAVGDVTSKKYRQITTAVADGTIAAMAIAKELN
jgi:thioredoxin reductase (NADPH)